MVARDHVNGRGPSLAMGGMKRSGRFLRDSCINNILENFQIFFLNSRKKIVCKAAYAKTEQIHFDNAFMRKDIGRRALAVLEG